MSLEIDEMRRRGALALAAALAAGVVVRVGGLNGPANAASQPTRKKGARADENKKEGEAGEDVSAAEDLMREHGVLRRTLIVYSELSNRLRANSGAVDPAAL